MKCDSGMRKPYRKAIFSSERQLPVLSALYARQPTLSEAYYNTKKRKMQALFTKKRQNIPPLRGAFAVKMNSDGRAYGGCCRRCAGRLP